MTTLDILASARDKSRLLYRTEDYPFDKSLGHYPNSDEL